MLMQADFKKMLLDLLLHYGVRDLKFLVEASCPQLERLRVTSLLLPTEDSLGSTLDAKASTTRQESYGSAGDANMPRCNAQALLLARHAPRSGGGLCPTIAESLTRSSEVALW